MIVFDYFPLSHVGRIESKNLNTYLETEEKNISRKFLSVK